MPAGYSGTPLSKKLGLKEGSRVFAADAPANYLKLLAPIPKGVHMASRLDANTDIADVLLPISPFTSACRTPSVPSPDAAPVDLLAALAEALSAVKVGSYVFGAQAALIWGRPRV